MSTSEIEGVLGRNLPEIPLFIYAGSDENTVRAQVFEEQCDTPRNLQNVFFIIS